MRIRFLLSILTAFCGFSFSADLPGNLTQLSLLSKKEDSPLPQEEVVLDVPVDSNYIVGPGDLFDLFMEENKISLQVSPEGSILIEEFGGVIVKDLPLYKAKEEILNLVTKKYPKNFCFVHLVRIRKFFVGIYGAVADARQIQISANLRLSYAIRSAGWFLPTANKEQLRLIRGNDTTIVNFLDIEMRGMQEKDIILQQGDIVLVPYLTAQSSLVTFRADGRVRNTAHTPGHTIWDYLEKLDFNRQDNAIIGFQYYPSTSSAPEYVAWEKSATLEPAPGSIIDIRRSNQTVMVGGAVAMPGPKEYISGWTAANYIGKSGVLYTTGNLSQVTVVRSDGTRASIDPQKDPIYPGDYIYIPRNSYEQVKDVVLFFGTIASIFLTIILAQQYLRN